MKSNHLEEQIRELGKAELQEIPPLLRSRQDEVYASLASIVQDPAEQKKNRKHFPKISAAAAALFLGVMLTSAYPPELANALKRLPWVGGIFERADDLGLQAAERLGLISRLGSRDTHEGITLSAEEAVFDGNRLVFSVKREGEGLDGKLTGVTVGPDGELFQEKGTITSAEVLIDKATLEEYSENLWSVMPLLSWTDGTESNTAIFKLVDSSDLSISAKPFPEHFELTVIISLEGINKPFILRIPAHKVTQNVIDTPDIRAQAEGWTLSLKKLEYSPITTRLSLTLEQETEGDNSATNLIGFEVRDEQGQLLKEISQKALSASAKSRNVDLLTEPFNKHPNMLNIRAYLNEFEEPDSKSGAFKTDSSGNPVKHYIEDLEINVLVQ
jgi:hypothetical protein